MVGQQQVRMEYSGDEKRLADVLRASLQGMVEDEPELVNDVIDYIVRQYNQESFGGVVNEMQYGELLDKSIEGLFDLVYLKYYTEEMERRDSIFWSCADLIVFLSSRILKGRDYHKAIEEIHSRTPVVVSPGAGR